MSTTFNFCGTGYQLMFKVSMDANWREVVEAQSGLIIPADSNTLMTYKDDGTFALMQRTGKGQPYVDFRYTYTETQNFGNSLGDMLLFLANHGLSTLSEPGLPPFAQGVND